MKNIFKSPKLYIGITIVLFICVFALYFFLHNRSTKIPERAIFVWSM
jgi:hypothetical protein